MREVIVRTLRREYRLVCANADIAAALEFMAIDPEIADTRLEPVHIPVVSGQGFLRMELPGGERIEGTPSHLLAVMHRCIRDDILQSEQGCILIHGGMVLHPSRPGGRILVIGGKGAGKTTLMLKLISQGFTVEGDEHIVLRPDGVIARPRTLRVKTGSLRLMPEFAPRIEALPSVDSWEGYRIHAVPPHIGGKPWIIRAGTAEDIVFLEANHGGLSMLRPLSTHEALRRLLSEAFLRDGSVSHAAARLRGLALKARCWRLSLGDLDGAVRHLTRGLAPRSERSDPPLKVLTDCNRPRPC